MEENISEEVDFETEKHSEADPDIDNGDESTKEWLAVGCKYIGMRVMLNGSDDKGRPWKIPGRSNPTA
jgi:hypothetical protein